MAAPGVGATEVSKRWRRDESKQQHGDEFLLHTFTFLLIN
jgi:hypothetical protein